MGRAHASQTKEKIKTMPSSVSAIAHSIYATHKISLDGVKAVFRLPAKDKVSPQELAAAVAWILKQYFDLTLNPDQVMAIEHSAKIDLTFPSAKGPFCRHVHVDFEKEPPTLFIHGLAPEDDVDGYSKVAFDWRKRSGTINADGTIDWKRINSLPCVDKNAHIATIFPRTEGTAGLDCYGKVIKQKPGRRRLVRWDKKSVAQDIDDENAPFYNLIAKNSGVVVYQFELPNDPKTLSSVSVTEKLTITGDIDYSLGDLESSASLEIVGSVRGNFSLVSDGYVHVSDSIEGKTVQAQKVMADLITNRCIVSAKEEVETGSITNAEANGFDVLIRKNASQAVLRAKEKISFARDAVVLGIALEAKAVHFDHCTFSGHSTVTLGGSLFAELTTLLPRMSILESQVTDLTREAKEAATAILNLLTQIEQFPVSRSSTLIRNLCLSLQQDFVRSFQAREEIGERAMDQCADLQEKIEEKTFDYSISKKLANLRKELPIYNAAYEDLSLIGKDFTGVRDRLQDLQTQILNDLSVTIKGGQAGGKNAKLKIICGEAELELSEGDLTGPGMEIRYHAPQDLLRLHTGKLQRN